MVRVYGIGTQRKVRNIPSVKQGLDERESRERICYRLWKLDMRYMSYAYSIPYSM